MLGNSIPGIAVVGSGYWGRNLVRTFHELGVLKCVCDTRQEVLTEAHQRYGTRTASGIDELLADPEITAVAIAAPAAQHFSLANRCLLANKDVYVEKPLALHAEEGRQLEELANERRRILMVGHILEYHPAVLELKRMIREGVLGNIHYIYSSRLNLGKLRTEENILWSFAPHDISAILFLLGEEPCRLSSHGGSYLRNNFDTTLTSCEFPSGAQAHIFVSWLHPFKEQKLTIVGGRKMAVFDDTERDRKLVLYSHTISWVDRIPIAEKHHGEVVQLPNGEPLRLECEHFVQCLSTRERPRTDGASALRVLKVLEGCERSLKAYGQPVEVGTSEPDYFAHPTAIIDPGVAIGQGTKIWHFSHIMSGSKIGKCANLGQNVVISPEVTIGNNVKIQNNVSVYTGVELQDDVFCGPSMVFTNVINPRSHIVRKHEYRRTLVKQGASLGANSTVVCGVMIGKYAFVGAGAVVTKDVADYALVVGVPAQRVGWMCYCGIRLPEGSVATCAECGRRYRIDAEECREVTLTAVEPDQATITEMAA